MKIAIITDTHYGARKGSKHLHDYFEKFYKDIFFRVKPFNFFHIQFMYSKSAKL